MRIVFIGASRLARLTAHLLLEDHHDVVIIEQDPEKAESLSAELACGVLHGDGSTPSILREADPAASDYLFCLTSNDQTNIIASLVGRSLGFKHIVTRVDTPEFEHICVELELENTIVPSRAIASQLQAIVHGIAPLSISPQLKYDAALFSFVATDAETGAVKELSLPDNCRLMIIYRDERFMLPDADTILKKDDEAVLICHNDQLEKLRERFSTLARKELN